MVSDADWLTARTLDDASEVETPAYVGLAKTQQD
jgi:hypothetical protein